MWAGGVGIEEDPALAAWVVGAGDGTFHFSVAGILVVIVVVVVIEGLSFGAAADVVGLLPWSRLAEAADVQEEAYALQ